MRLFILAFLFIPVSILAQNTNYYGLFPTIDHSAELNKKWSYNIYIFDAIKHYESKMNGSADSARSFYFYAETGISYAISKKLSFTCSYVYERQNTFNTNY